MDEQVCRWSEALRLAAFDEWIFNRDRIPNNLVFAGDGHFWLIDHDDALPGYASPTTSANNQLLQLLCRDKSEFELFEMRRALRVFIDNCKSIDWDEVFALVKPDELPNGRRIFRRHIDFLKERTERLDEIFSEVLGIRQSELELGLSTSISKRKER